MSKTNSTTQQLEGEIWKPIPDFPRYEVSNLGRVRSWCNFASGTAHTPRILKPYISSDRRLRFTPVRDGKTYYVSIHRSVLLAFVGPCPEGMEACHENDNCQDNRLDNLRWDYHEANRAEETEHGLEARGERHGFAKLTEAQVIAIRERHATGERAPALAKEYGTTRLNVNDIVRGETWRHVGGQTFNPHTTRGEANGRAKLTENDVRIIRKRAARGETALAIAREYGVGWTTVKKVVSRETWKHVQ